MLRVSYVKDVPCTLYETLSQYYDFEHVATVHPESLGRVERIGNEDLAVGVCIDGWPGVPAAARAHVPKRRQDLAYPPLPKGFDATSLRPLEIEPCSIDGRSAVLVRAGASVRKLPPPPRGGGVRRPRHGGALAGREPAWPL